MPALSIQHAKNNTIADFTGVVTVGNSTGGTATANASDLVRPSDWNSEHNFSITMSASDIASLLTATNRVTMSTNTSGITFGLNNELDFFELFPLAAGTQNLVYGQQTWYFNPINIPGALNSGVIQNAFSFGTGISTPFGMPASTISSGSTGYFTRAGTFYNRLGVYEKGTGVNTSRLESRWTNEQTWILSEAVSVTTSAATALGVSKTVHMSYPNTWDASGGVTYATTSNSYGTTVGASTMAVSVISTRSNLSQLQALVTGGVIIPSGFDYRLGAGEWFFAHNYATLTATSQTGGGYSLGQILSTIAKLGLSEVVNTSWKMVGQSISNSSTNFMQGNGFYATTASTAPNNIPITNIRVNATNPRVYWNFQKKL